MGVKLKPSDYVHLHNHTHHSLLDGLTKIPELMNAVKDFGMHAVAITDHGTMSGVIEFYKAGLATDVKPILGFEAYVATRSRHDRDPSKDKARFHLTILAMNNQGYQNLMRLASLSHLEGMYYKPRIDHELLEKYNEGLIILSGCASGEINESLKTGNYEEAKNIAQWYKSVFGDRYYLELQDHGHPDNKSSWDVQTELNGQLDKLSQELDIPCVITNDAHYIKHEDQEAHEILLCVGTAAFLSDKDRMSLKEFDLHVEDPANIIERWGSTHSEAILNTKRIADRCNVDIKLGGILIPTFPVPKSETEKSYLDKLVYKGLAVRYADKTKEQADEMESQDIRSILAPEVLERVDMELEVLDKMKYNGYFLIVHDFIKWGKDRGIIFGPGRGSAAGSIVAYALNITELDPLKYDLLFERFLNPDRISMPDIDIDIQDTRRDEVIEYCSEKYGSDRVANIVTFGTMAARAAVRDVARVLQVPYGESDRLAKLIPPPIQGRHIPLARSIIDDPDLKHEYATNPTAKEVFDYAIRLEGTIRSHGVHAAGVVIAPDEIIKYAPVEMAQKGVVSTQYAMGPIEDIGLLKMDFLGLSNLSIIKNTLRTIKKVYGEDIDISKIPLDDEKTFELYRRGDTTGVFQLESSGMKRYLRELKPTGFNDIIAICALYRPGPLTAGLTQLYIDRKNGKKNTEYPHERMEAALKDTYGVLVYQEQVMQISKEVCGFTGGQADTLRKAIGKKNREIMAKMEIDFINGGVDNGGVPRPIMEQFWKDLLGFADYSFNKSHSACYAMIAYWTGYLKAHFPDAFMAALMTSDRDNIERLAIEINECKHMGIEVLSPDVNESFVEFAIVPGKSQIRFGMAAVKGVGESAVDEILRAREIDGKFKSIEDFAKRVSTSKFNRRAWESLIKSGGFDSFGDRSDLLSNLEAIQAYASKLQKEALSGQIDLFDILGDDRVQSSIDMKLAEVKYSDKDKLTWERELLGLYVSAHPLDNYTAYFDEQTVPLNTIGVEFDGKNVTVGGVINSVRTIITKSGSKMAFVKIEDIFGEVEVVIFPTMFEKIGDKLDQDAVVQVSGRINARDKDGNLRNEAGIIADDVAFLSQSDLKSYESTGKKMKSPKPTKRAKEVAVLAEESKPVVEAQVPVEESAKKLYIHIKNPDNHEALNNLKTICSEHPGMSAVVLVLGDSKKSAIKLPFKVDSSDKLIDSLVKSLGEDSIVLK